MPKIKLTRGVISIIGISLLFVSLIANLVLILNLSNTRKFLSQKKDEINTLKTSLAAEQKNTSDVADVGTEAVSLALTMSDSFDKLDTVFQKYDSLMGDYDSLFKEDCYTYNTEATIRSYEALVKRYEELMLEYAGLKLNIDEYLNTEQEKINNLNNEDTTLYVN